jgi:putative salt-induced outer membrane protein
VLFRNLCKEEFSMTRSLIAAMLLLPTTASIVAAQDSVPPRPWKLQTDFGFVNTAGNTSTTTLNAGEHFSYTTGPWKFGQLFAVVYGRTDGEESAENYTAGLRGDYAFSEHFGAYALGNWNRDEFAGIERRFEEGGGLTFTPVAKDRTTLSFEAGISANQQRSTDGIDDSFTAGRGALLFKQAFATSAYFQQTAEVLPNLQQRSDYRVNSETALVAPLSKAIAFKASYVIKFDNDPEPGFEETDRFLTSGLQIVF